MWERQYLIRQPWDDAAMTSKEQSPEELAGVTYDAAEHVVNDGSRGNRF